MPGFDYGIVPLAESTRLSEVKANLFPYDGQSGYVSGLAKLAQSVLYLLGTSPGSVAYDPELGASPVDEILNRGSVTKEIVDNAIAQSEKLIYEQIRIWNGSAANDDERIGSLSISADDYDESQTLIKLQVALSSAAGDRAVYTVSLALVG